MCLKIPRACTIHIRLSVYGGSNETEDVVEREREREAKIFSFPNSQKSYTATSGQNTGSSRYALPLLVVRDNYIPSIAIPVFLAGINERTQSAVKRDKWHFYKSPLFQAAELLYTHQEFL